MMVDTNMYHLCDLGLGNVGGSLLPNDTRMPLVLSEAFLLQSPFYGFLWHRLWKYFALER
jgi:hypothetical protein